MEYFQHFNDLVYQADNRHDVLNAINEFLEDSLVLPPGNWDEKTLLPILNLAKEKTKARGKEKKAEKEMGETSWDVI